MSNEIQTDSKIVEKSQSDTLIKISNQEPPEAEPELLVENEVKGQFGDFDLHKDINGILLQYLESLNLEKSYREFVLEAREMRIPLPEGVQETFEKPPLFSKEDGLQLLEDFEMDNSDSVINLWNRFLTGINIKHQEDFKKLTFYVMIYAAIIPFKSDESTEDEKTESMNTLHKFFLDKSNDFVTDDTMLSLFALPFIPDPKGHPLFSALFLPIWKEKLRSQLTIAVEKYVEITKLSSSAAAEDSDLYKMFRYCLGKTAERLALKEFEYDPPAAGAGGVPAEMEGLKNELLDFEDRYYKLLKVTAEVVDTLDKYVKGKLEDMSLLRKKVHQLYPELFAGGTSGAGDDISAKMDEIAASSLRKPNVRPSTSTRRKPVIACRSKSKYRQSQQNQRVVLQRSRTYVVRKSASQTPKSSGRDASPAIEIAHEHDDYEQHGDHSEASVSKSSSTLGLSSKTPIKTIHGSTSLSCPSSSRSKIPIAIKSTSAIKMTPRSPHPPIHQQMYDKSTSNSNSPAPAILTQSASLTLQNSHPPPAAQIAKPKPRFCHSQGPPTRVQPLPKGVCKKSRVPLLKKGSRTNISGPAAPRLNGNQQLQIQVGNNSNSNGNGNGSDRARSADDYFIEERSRPVQQSEPNTARFANFQQDPPEWVYDESDRPASAYETRSNSDFEVVLSPRRKPARKRD